MTAGALTPGPSPAGERGVEPDSFTAEGDEERVGHGRSRDTRFRPGQSGNPRGRPKRSRALGAIVARAFGEVVEAKENGKPTRMTKLEATVKQLVNRAASGDQRAAQFLLPLLRDALAAAPPPEPEDLSRGDALVVADLVRRLSQSS
jgi:hypothetical protein